MLHTTIAARRHRILLAAVALAALPAVAAAAGGTRVVMSSPPAGQPAFGEIELRADVRSDAAVQYVDFYVDGQRAGRVEQPPFALTFDLGQANVPHELKAVATVANGTTATGVVQTPNIPSNMDIEVELEQLFVSVAGNDGRPVLGLGEADFEVREEGGGREQIVTFGGGDLPISSVLLLDSSESMRGEALQAALAGVRAFVARTREDDETMVAFFSDRLLAATTFARDDAALQRALGEVHAAGGTAVNDHLYYALNRLQPRLGRRVVVLLSDGLDVSSFLDMEQVLWRARRSQAMIYWLRLRGNVSEKNQDRKTGTPLFQSSWRDVDANRKQYLSLTQAVEESGGRILDIHQLGEIDDAFRQVIDELRQQYVLGFHARNAKNDGSWRPIEVRVRKSGVNVRSRAGFVD